MEGLSCAACQSSADSAFEHAALHPFALGAHLALQDAHETLESSQQLMQASRVCSTLGHSPSIAGSATSSLSELLGSFPDEGHVEPPASRSDRGGDGGGAVGWGMGVVDRLDSAHYEARPAGLLERQDSANEVRNRPQYY